MDDLGLYMGIPPSLLLPNLQLQRQPQVEGYPEGQQQRPGQAAAGADVGDGEVGAVAAMPEEIQEGDLAIGEMEVFTQKNGGFWRIWS